jgi:hypothetical protein
VNIFERRAGQRAQILNSGSVLPVVLKMQRSCLRAISDEIQGNVMDGMQRMSASPSGADIDCNDRDVG